VSFLSKTFFNNHAEKSPASGASSTMPIKLAFSHRNLPFNPEVPCASVAMWGVDNHACILLRIKNTLGIQKKVTAVLRPLQAWLRGQLVVHRTDSKQEVRNRRLSFFPILYNSVYNSRWQLRLRLQSTTPIYYSAPQSLLLITAEDPPTPSTTTTAVTKVVFAFRAENFEKYHFENS
jgi:hypothetical protein